MPRLTKLWPNSPELGPLIGGFVNQFTHWRWSFWLLMIWSGVQLVIITIFVPETYKPVLLRQKAIKLRKETGDSRWQAPIEKMERSILNTILLSCKRPFELLFLEPMVSHITFISKCRCPCGERLCTPISKFYRLC
jgi:MFS family permease